MDVTCLFFSLKWDSWMSWYVGSPSTLVRKVVDKEKFMYVTFNMVLDNHFLWWILLVRWTLCGSGYKTLGSDTFL